MTGVTEEAITQLYEVAVKVFPEFATLVNLDQIILNYAPFKIKSSVKEVLKIVRESIFGENEQQALSELFQQIFFENEDYSQNFA